MKPSHTARENWRTENSETEAWFSKLNIVERIALGLAFIAVVFGAAGYLSLHWGDLSIRQLLEDFYANASTELLSIAITVLVIERLTRLLNTEERNKELILQMGSDSNAFALEAVRKLRHYGWLTDGSLRRTRMWNAKLQGSSLELVDMQEADLQGTNLQDARLWGANLQGAQLGKANLSKADMTRANLQGAFLGSANLQEAIMDYVTLRDANLWGANLQKARLGRANLENAVFNETDLNTANLWATNLQEATIVNCVFQDAILSESNLRGATLWRSDLQRVGLRKAILEKVSFYKTQLQGADLSDANLRNAVDIRTSIFDTNTILPNGDHWHDGYDLTIFTNPDHPSFWELKWVKAQREQENNALSPE